MTADELCGKFYWHPWEQDASFLVDEKSGRIFERRHALKIQKNRIKQASEKIVRILIDDWDERGVPESERSRLIADFERFSKTLNTSARPERSEDGRGSNQ